MFLIFLALFRTYKQEVGGSKPPSPRRRSRRVERIELNAGLKAMGILPQPGGGGRIFCFANAGDVSEEGNDPQLTRPENTPAHLRRAWCVCIITWLSQSPPGHFPNREMACHARLSANPTDLGGA